MKKVKTLFYPARFFFLTTLLLLVLSGVFYLVLSKTGSFLAINGLRHPWANEFFINYTFMGDGLFVIGLVVWFFFRKQKKLAANVLSAFLLSGVVVQLIKNLVYAPRPKLFFEAGQYLHCIDGVTLSNSSSFPSGHTASAFALAMVLAMHYKNNLLGVLLALGAALAGYSRIYLAQHFLGDVWLGALLGIVFGAIACMLLNSSFRFSIRRRNGQQPAWYNNNQYNLR